MIKKNKKGLWKLFSFLLVSILIIGVAAASDAISTSTTSNTITASTGIVCEEPICPANYEKYFTGEYDTNDCKIYKCRDRNIECPLYAYPGPDWCKDGEIVSRDDDSNGCPRPPTCIVDVKSCDVIRFNDMCYNYGDVIKVKVGDKFSIPYEIIDVTYIDAPSCGIDDEGRKICTANVASISFEITPKCEDTKICAAYIRSLNIVKGETEKLYSKVSLKLIGVESDTSSISNSNQRIAKLEIINPIECPQYSTSSPEWCKNGKIVAGDIDSNGCQGPPQCKPINICKSEGLMCGGIGGIQCCPGLTCELEGNYPDASGKCIVPPSEKCYKNSDCSSNQFCEFASCEWPESGKCIEKPNVCSNLYDPECGCDGITYSNDCVRKSKGVSKKHDGKCEIKCAKEGEYTSGAVSPEYQYGCCEGFKSFNPRPGSVGGGSLCYNPKKGTPVCKGVDSKSEGWYYPTGELLRYEGCEVKACEVIEFNNKCYDYNNEFYLTVGDWFSIQYEIIKVADIDYFYTESQQMNINEVVLTSAINDESNAETILTDTTTIAEYDTKDRIPEVREYRISGVITLGITAKCEESAQCTQYYREVQIITGTTEKLSGDVTLKLESIDKMSLSSIKDDVLTAKLKILDPKRYSLPEEIIYSEESTSTLIEEDNLEEIETGPISTSTQETIIYVDSSGESQICNGCIVKDKCINYGIRMKNGESTYCDIDGTIKTQKIFEDTCENNYECLSNSCSNGECIDLNKQLEETKGILNKIYNWLKSIFG